MKVFIVVIVNVRGSFLDAAFKPPSQSGRIFDLDQFTEQSEILENMDTRLKAQKGLLNDLLGITGCHLHIS